MSEIDLLAALADRVIVETRFWTAWVGVVGGIVGGVLTISGNLLLLWLRERPIRHLDSKRTKMLVQMLNDKRFPKQWRDLATLSAVIGADERNTKRLLIEAGARGSEVGDGKWGLIKNHPFPGPGPDDRK